LADTPKLVQIKPVQPKVLQPAQQYIPLPTQPKPQPAAKPDPAIQSASMQAANNLLAVAKIAQGGVNGAVSQTNIVGIIESPVVGKDKANNRQAVYNAFVLAGFSQNQALALTAEVGRENSFDTKTMFGTHSDLGNNKTNLGFFSWQGARKPDLVRFLKDNNAVDSSGNMIRNQNALNAMAKFAKYEIENKSEYSKTKSKFLDHKNIDPEVAAPILGRNYIGWAYGQNAVNKGTIPFDWKSHDQRRRNHLRDIKNDVNKSAEAQKANLTSHTFTSPNTLSESPTKINPYKEQANRMAMNASNVTIHQSFKTDMTINGAMQPVESARAVQRQHETGLAIMMRNAQGILV